MKILSFNLLCYGSGRRIWKKRVPKVVEAVKSISPDVFGVQEAHIGWMKALSKNLPEYEYAGVGRDDGKEEGEFSAVFYKKDKFILEDSGTFWLSETPERPGLGWDAACIRICTYAALSEKESGKRFMHFNTHLDHIGEKAMLCGARLVAERAEKLCDGRTVILTGDFNVTPDSQACSAVKAAGFTDCRDAAAITDTGVTFHAFSDDENKQSVIDYIFVKGTASVNEFKVIREKFSGDYPSDHYPVFADIDF